MSNTKKAKAEGVKSPSVAKRKTSDEEQRWWDALYMYVKNNVLELDPKLNLSQYTVMRLKGMAQGCFIGKEREQCNLTYGYRVVLAAFDKMAPLLRYGLKNTKFKNMQHKINWMFAVVEPHLNEAYQDEETENKRQEILIDKSDAVMKDIERYQSINKHTSSGSDIKFKTAKELDKKHEDMW